MPDNESTEIVDVPGPGSREERREGLRRLLREWWDPPAELIDTLPKAGIQLKYLSHVWVSRAFTEIDPEWTWAPMSYDDSGQPVFDRDQQGRPVGLWITLTLCGTTIPGYGSVEAGKHDAVKELIGDALRNAGMRRGCGGKLWTKEKAKKPPAKKKEPLPAAAEPPDESPHEEKAAGKDAYDSLVEEYGEKAVNGALATFGVAKFSEITPVNLNLIRASLMQRARVVDDLFTGGPDG